MLSRTGMCARLNYEHPWEHEKDDHLLPISFESSSLDTVRSISTRRGPRAGRLQ